LTWSAARPSGPAGHREGRDRGGPAIAGSDPVETGTCSPCGRRPSPPRPHPNSCLRPRGQGRQWVASGWGVTSRPCRPQPPCQNSPEPRDSGADGCSRRPNPGRSATAWRSATRTAARGGAAGVGRTCPHCSGRSTRTYWYYARIFKDTLNLANQNLARKQKH